MSNAPQLGHCTGSNKVITSLKLDCEKSPLVKSSQYLTFGYSNMDCLVFKQGVQNLKDFCLRINIPKESDFECNGEASKTVKI